MPIRRTRRRTRDWPTPTRCSRPAVWRRRPRAYPAARDAASRAIELDPSLAEGHASLGLVRLNYDWDWEGAERELRTAIELNPSYSTARQWYSSYLSSMARFDEAIASAQQAAAVDPFSITATIRVGIAYTYAMEYEQGGGTTRARQGDGTRLPSRA